MNKHQNLYLAGPMTGLAEHNFPAFHKAAKRWREMGWAVANPADNFGGRTDLTRSSYLRADLMMLMQCDAAAFLPGWRRSAGAKLEYLLARELAMPIYDAQTMRPMKPLPSAMVTILADEPESILDEADRTTGIRNAHYGHPRDDFSRAAKMFSGILAGKLRDDQQITADDIPLCMVAVKLARQAHRHNRDNLVDIAGYARTAAMVRGEE